jgi:hypothetical protein
MQLCPGEEELFAVGRCRVLRILREDIRGTLGSVCLPGEEATRSLERCAGLLVILGGAGLALEKVSGVAGLRPFACRRWRQ